jgi:hypothetical protein
VSNYSTSSRTGRALVQRPHPGLLEQEASPERPKTLLKPSEVVPTATYIERGQRWMEKEEAVSLRDALEDKDILKQQQEEEARVHAAAQKEASELVWQHENPGAIRPHTPYKYKEHLKKNSYAHARTQSVGRYTGTALATGLARDIPRSVSGGSSNSGEMLSHSRVSSGSSGISQQVIASLNSPTFSNDQTEASASKAGKKSYYGLSKTVGPSTGRRASGKRNISGELYGRFTGEQIWEEPEETDLNRGRTPEGKDMPAPLRLKARNPLNRVQFAHDLPERSKSTPPAAIAKSSKVEIHQNPPSQSRNPAYMANPSAHTSPVSDAPPVPMKNGIEIRSDDIRQATSKSLKDRSPRLPTPAVVSDKPGRPIVSFDANWRPKEADVKAAEEPRRPKLEGQYGHSREAKSLPSIPVAKNLWPVPIPTIQLPDSPSIQVNGASTPPIPDITVSPTSIPSINFPDTPTISVSDSTPIPIPAINVMSSLNNSRRPLPDPKTSSSRPLPRHHATAQSTMSKRHWSPAAGNRATATCHQCELPIEGRVVALRGLSQRFHPHCFICYTCGTSLEALEISPEPAPMRAARLSRIQRRAAGEQLEDIEGQTIADDGDERLRFYCHLDWHELYAPRCKHCKTPIIGEHAVALGEHWHYGHFFCAECGDPFEQGMTHIEKDGYAWCLRCETKRTERRAPKCKECKKPVIGQYVQALGGEYHDECFRCASCGGGFGDGESLQIFIREEGSESVAVCVGCMERELKA